MYLDDIQLIDSLHAYVKSLGHGAIGQLEEKLVFVLGYKSIDTQWLTRAKGSGRMKLKDFVCTLNELGIGIKDLVKAPIDLVQPDEPGYMQKIWHAEGEGVSAGLIDQLSKALHVNPVSGIATAKRSAGNFSPVQKPKVFATLLSCNRSLLKFNDAIAAYQIGAKTCQSNSDLAELKLRAAFILHQFKRHEEALEEIEKAIGLFTKDADLDGICEGLASKASMLGLQGRAKECLAIFEKLDLSNARLSYRTTQMQWLASLDSGRYGHLAEEAFEELLKAGHVFSAARILWSSAREKKEGDPSALSLFERCLDLMPHWGGVDRALASLDYASRLIRFGDLEKASQLCASSFSTIDYCEWIPGVEKALTDILGEGSATGGKILETRSLIAHCRDEYMSSQQCAFFSSLQDRSSGRILNFSEG